MNYLMLSAGRRAELLKYFRLSAEPNSKIIAADLSPYAPALYFADKRYIVPRIDSTEYIESVLDICKKEKVNAVTTLIDPEIAILARNRNKFEKIGVEVLAPYEETAELCFNKYSMYKFLSSHNIPTVMTWGSIEDFSKSYNENKVDFPVFVKPRTGSGSVGARKIISYELLEEAMSEEPGLIIQEFMDCEDLDADVYIDTISHKAVSIFSKRKVETRIGGASKTISFKDPKLFEFISEIVDTMKFNGPVDMDFFYKDGKYYLSEINPRFGGAYLHAYGAGIDFIKLIEKNLKGFENIAKFGTYDEDIVMMMYDSVVIRRQSEIRGTINENTYISE